MKGGLIHKRRKLGKNQGGTDQKGRRFRGYLIFRSFTVDGTGEKKGSRGGGGEVSVKGFK